jgi:uncharacterized BrkB/YihY/UPF0761 family membrane protein
MYRSPLPIGGILWLLIGVIVASSHHYFDNVGTLGGLLSALLAVLLWPLVLLGTRITITL